MKKFDKLHIASRLGLAALLLLISANLIFGEKASYQRDKKAMARHFFQKGAIAEATGKSDVAYEYYKKAFAADSDYVDAAFAFGTMRTLLEHDTLATRQEKLKGLRMARKFVDAFPTDLQSGMHYAYLASYIDTVPEAIRVLEILEKAHPDVSMLQIYKANSYGAIGNADSAISAIRHFERLEGMSFETSVRKLRYHLLKNDTVGAIKEIDILLDQNPGQTEYITYKAKVFEMLELPDSAFKYLNLAVEMNPADGVAKAELADLYAQRGDSATHDKLVLEALLADNLELGVKTQILSQYLQRMIDNKADLTRSDMVFEKLKEQYPHEPQVLFIGAKYSAAKKDYKEALRQIDYAMSLDGQNPEYLNPRMSYLLLDGNPEESMRVYRQALKDSLPTDPSTSMIFITAAQEANQPEAAIAALDSLIKMQAPAISLYDSVVDLSALKYSSFYELYLLSDYYQLAGDIYYRMDNLPATFRSYQNAISIFPDNDLALNNYAYFLVEKGGYAPGSPEFEKAKTMSAKSVEDTQEKPQSTYLDTYAWILFKEKDYENAETVQKMAIESAPEDADDAELFSHYGDILFMLGKKDEALEQWKKALKFDPDNELLKKKVNHKTYYEK